MEFRAYGKVHESAAVDAATRFRRYLPPSSFPSQVATTTTRSSDQEVSVGFKKPSFCEDEQSAPMEIVASRLTDTGVQNSNQLEHPPPFNTTDDRKPRKSPHYLRHEDRCRIIQRIVGGETQAALAREFGVTRAAVCHMYKHRHDILSRPRGLINGHLDESDLGLSGVPQMVYELRTPAILHLLTTLRNRQTTAANYRRATGRAIMILLEDAVGQLETNTTRVITTSGHSCNGLERRDAVCGIILGDEGYPFGALFHQLEVDASRGVIYVEEVINHRGLHQWRLTRVDFPVSISTSKVLLFTATCSNGERECTAIEVLLGAGVHEQDITLVTLVCASDGIAAICSRFSVDEGVDPQNRTICPGIGDFVSRYNDEDLWL